MPESELKVPMHIMDAVTDILLKQPYSSVWFILEDLKKLVKEQHPEMIKKPEAEKDSD